MEAVLPVRRGATALPWVWPLRPPQRLGERVWSAAGLADRACLGGRWVLTAVAAGALPVLLSGSVGLPGHQVLSSTALVGVCLAFARRDAWKRAVGAILLAFAAHNAAAVVLALGGPEAAARVMPGAAEYWSRQLLWIRTGWDPEYEASSWVPAHLGQAGGGIACSYASLGWLTFHEGFLQVDWMNYYCAQLMRHSLSPVLALLLGWHVWSLLRGLGLALLTFEVISLSLGRLTGRELSPPRRRVLRWTAALGFLAADGALKLFLMRPVQEALLANLR